MAYPTLVNSQITDAVTQSGVSTLATKARPRWPWG